MPIDLFYLNILVFGGDDIEVGVVEQRGVIDGYHHITYSYTRRTTLYCHKQSIDGHCWMEDRPSLASLGTFADSLAYLCFFANDTIRKFP